MKPHKPYRPALPSRGQFVWIGHYLAQVSRIKSSRDKLMPRFYLDIYLPARLPYFDMHRFIHRQFKIPADVRHLQSGIVSLGPFWPDEFITLPPNPDDYMDAYYTDMKARDDGWPDGLETIRHLRNARIVYVELAELKRELHLPETHLRPAETIEEPTPIEQLTLFQKAQDPKTFNA